MLLDTRTKKEYEVSHIPNAIHVDFDSAMKSKDLISTIQNSANQQQRKANINENKDAEDEKVEKNKIDFLNTNIYCYCSVGWRSSIMVEKLNDAIIERNKTDDDNKDENNSDKITKEKLSNVKNVQGSIFEWVNQGNPVVNNANQNVEKVHTYNRVWGLLVDDQEKRVC